MHWSRLLDGVLAGLDGLLSASLSGRLGELALRLAWPLLLIGPALAAAFEMTRRLAGRADPRSRRCGRPPPHVR